MKKIIIALLIIILPTFLIFNQQVKATDQAATGIPYDTYTLGEYNKIVRTQTAYIPVGTIANLSFNGPQDIYQKDNLIYVADTGNKQVVKLDLKGELLETYDNLEFKAPTGVFVTEESLYVADKDARTVFVIDLDSKVITRRITRPTSPIFGVNNSFIPTKVVVGSNDSIYVVGEGSTSGIIQLNYVGEFVGYLGINTVSVSFRKFLYNLFVRDSDLASSLPPSPTNVALGQKGSILTTNMNFSESFKRLNITGVNTLLGETKYPESTLSDIWMSETDYIYLVSQNGYVYEYDVNGRLLFQFNTKDNAMKQGLGLTSAPSGVVTDQDGNLYVLDRVYNNIQIYQKTVFVDLVHRAVSLYNDGRYIEAEPIWEEILKENSSFALAHTALGEARLKQGDFSGALDSFYQAKDLNGYSNAYWEIRNIQIQNNLVLWLVLALGLFIFVKVFKKTYKYIPLYEKAQTSYHKVKKTKFYQDISISKNIFKKPADLASDIKVYNRGSYLSAIIIFILFLLVYLVDAYASGFLFRNPSRGSVISEASIVVLLFFLFIFVNYLVSTFSDGEGRFRDVFIISCYALVPFIIFTPIMTVLSHFLTYNESFIYSFYNQILLYYTIFLFIYTMKEVHNYTLFETIKSILLILFGILIIILMGLLIYAFIGQVWDFVSSLIKEVIYRV